MSFVGGVMYSVDAALSAQKFDRDELGVIGFDAVLSDDVASDEDQWRGDVFW
jgi:hypothetical protein